MRSCPQRPANDVEPVGIAYFQFDLDLGRIRVLVCHHPIDAFADVRFLAAAFVTEQVPFDRVEGAALPGTVWAEVMCFITFLLILFVSGCGPKGSGMGRFTIEKTVGEYCCIQDGKNDDKVALVVWVDEGSFGPSTVGGHPPLRGEFVLKDGRKIDWACSPRDAKTGRVEIAGVPYDLEKGGLFLISTKEGGTKVEQLPIETVGGTFNAAKEKLESLAKTDAKIKAFVSPPKDK
jgi:hypothetical protein